MSDVVIFSVGGILFIATTWATIAFALTRVIPREDDQSGVDRNEVDSLPPPSQA
jgi:hypothetical protein